MAIPSAAVGPGLDHIPVVLRAVQRLLSEAGAIVLLGDLAAWNAGQLHDAEVWALAQIEATSKAKPGTSVSIAWPEHVAEAALVGERRGRGNRRVK